MAGMFPDRYEKPVLIDLFQAAAAGWAASCSTGSSPNQTPILCSRGSTANLQKSAVFMSPEIIGEGL